MVIAAAVAMQVYVKRGMQAKVKGAVDFDPDTLANSDIFSSKQYEPYYNTSSMQTTREATETTTTGKAGLVERKLSDTGEVIESWGTSQVTALGAQGQ